MPFRTPEFKKSKPESASKEPSARPNNRQQQSPGDATIRTVQGSPRKKSNISTSKTGKTDVSMSTSNVPYPLDFKKVPNPTKGQLCVSHMIRLLQKDEYDYEPFDQQQSGIGPAQLVEMFLEGKIVNGDNEVSYTDCNETALSKDQEIKIRHLSNLRWLIVNWKDPSMVAPTLKLKLEQFVSREDLAETVSLGPCCDATLKKVYVEECFRKLEFKISPQKLVEETPRVTVDKMTTDHCFLFIMIIVDDKAKRSERHFHFETPDDGRKEIEGPQCFLDPGFAYEGARSLKVLLRHFNWRLLNWDVDRPEDLATLIDCGRLARLNTLRFLEIDRGDDGEPVSFDVEGDLC